MEKRIIEKENTCYSRRLEFVCGANSDQSDCEFRKPCSEIEDCSYHYNGQCECKKAQKKALAEDARLFPLLEIAEKMAKKLTIGADKILEEYNEFKKIYEEW